jgi:hypothetical protein
MKKKIIIRSGLCLILLLSGGFLMAQSTGIMYSKPFELKKQRALPLGADWAAKKGIDLPSPFGVSAFFTYMGRDIDVTDVTVEFGGREPQSITKYTSFGVKNQTYVGAIKFDAWILPVLNVYALAGYTGTHSNLNVDISIDRPVSSLPPVDMSIQASTWVKGPYTGIGSTLVSGYKNWFIMADGNYGITWPDIMNNSVSFIMLSLRSGISGKLGDKNCIRTWLGGAYINSKSTIEFKENSDVLGEVIIRVEQKPVNPWTYECGFLIGVGKRFEFMTELGSNFADASIFVMNIAYRF